MTPLQLERRSALLLRNNAAIDRWPAPSPRLRTASPQRTGQDFLLEMTAVAEALETLAREADSAGGDQLERSRTWRYVGNAYFDLANATDFGRLQLAIDAYRRSDALLSGTGNASERTKLDYYYGHALLHLSAGTDLPLLRESQSRYASAVEIARAVNDPAASHFQEALANVDRVIAFLTQDAEESTAPVTDDITLTGKLFDQYTKDVVAGKVSETRQQALDSVLSELGDLVGNSPDDVPGLTIQISRGLDAAKSILPLTATSQDASTLPAGSRAEAVWKRFSGLKLYLAQDLTLQISQRERVALKLSFPKSNCSKSVVTQTFLHKPGRSDKTVSGSDETDTLRQLACDVRAFSLCHHLTLVSPLWPSLPLPQDPSAVFFSGGGLLRESLVHVCAKKQLKLLPRAAPKDFRVQSLGPAQGLPRRPFRFHRLRQA